jgi:hypothetical protein
MIKMIFSVVVVLFLSSCSTVEVVQNHDTTVDFSTMKTYAWFDVNEPLSGNVRVDKSDVKQYVRKAVEKVLMAKGYIKGAEVEADFLVTWLGAVEKKVTAKNIDHFYRPYGYAALQQDPRWKKENTPTPNEFPEGALILDFLDPASQKLVWRGVGKEKVGKAKTPEEVERVISRIVVQILSTFPSGE